MTGGRQPAQRLDGEPHGCGPAARRPVELRGDLRVGAPDVRLEQLGRLAGVERERRARELEHLPLPAKAFDRERQLAARRENEVEPRRRLSAERLDQLHGAG